MIGRGSSCSRGSVISEKPCRGAYRLRGEAGGNVDVGPDVSAFTIERVGADTVACDTAYREKLTAAFKRKEMA